MKEKVEAKFKIGNIICDKVWKRAVHKIVSMDDSAYYFENGGKVEIINQELWELAEEPASEDLEEVATKYGTDEFPSLCSRCKHIPIDAFKDGAKWQKEQMMANAVEVTVRIDAGGYPYTPEIELYDYDKDVSLAKEGDRYKVILIKED